MMTETDIQPLNRLEHLLRRVEQTQVLRNHGRVVQLIGLVIESEGPLVAVGEICRIESARHDGSTLAEVVGFRNHHVLLMPLGEVHGIHPGSEVIALGTSLRVPVGEQRAQRLMPVRNGGQQQVPGDHRTARIFAISPARPSAW